MLTELFTRLSPATRRRSLPASPPAWMSLADPELAGSPIPADQLLLVFRDDRLLDVRNDSAPPQPPAGGERWWLVPQDDRPLDVLVSVGERAVVAETSIRFEHEANLLTLNADGEGVTRQDLVDLVGDTLEQLLEESDVDEPLDPVSLDDVDRETLRARLSNRLQRRSLRCTRLEFSMPDDEPGDDASDSRKARRRAEAELHDQLASTTRRLRSYRRELIGVLLIGGGLLFLVAWLPGNIDRLPEYLLAFGVVVAASAFLLSPLRWIRRRERSDILELATVAGMSRHRLKSLVAHDYPDLDDLWTTDDL